MKRALISMLLAGIPLAVPGEQVLVLGDSLSKEYDIEFVLENFPDRVRSWTQILDDKRGGFFDLGEPVNNLGPEFAFLLLPGHEYNWSFPSGTMKDFVDLVEEKTIGDRFARDVLESRIDDVERVVLFVGGNDVDSVYQTAYEGRSVAGFTDEFLEQTETVLDWVIGEAPGREIVVVNAPHVGATPEVKGDHPYDPVLTGNATAAFAELNRRMEALAAEKGVGYADIFALTLPLLDDDVHYCYQGVAFENAGSDDGRQERLWLDGPAAQNFHPNTLPQALIANAVIGAFNTRYGTGIRPLSTREILEELVGRDPEVSYAEWAACFGVGSATEDEDGDGFPNGIEFGTGGDPLAAETDLFFAGGSVGGVEIVFKKRLDDSVRAESSGGLGNWVPVDPVPLPDGRFRAFLPAGNGRGFLRLAVP